MFGANIDIGAYEYQGTLPVTLLNFTARADKNVAKLQWQTSNEVNNKGFILLRGGDDKSFVKIFTQAPNGSAPVATYHFTDYTPLNGTNYYRLVQLDLDGRESDLGTRALNFNLTNSIVRYYPNPVVQQLKLDFESGKYQNLALIDITGKKLQEHLLNKTQSNFELEMSAYQKGTYFVEFRGIDGHQLIKVVK